MLNLALNDFRSLLSDTDKRGRITTIALVGAILALQLVGAIVVALFAGRFIPVEQRVHRTVAIDRVERVKRIIVPVPSDRTYPPLDDPKKACTGAPVVIIRMLVNQATGDKDNETHTWLAVRPAGDAYTVICTMAGDYSGDWGVGDLVSLPKGDAAG